jgi:hypothetical protein
MKKLFLLLTIGSIAISAQAQQNTSIVLASPIKNNGSAQLLTPAQTQNSRELSPLRHSNPGARTTTGTNTDWYDMFGQNETTSSLEFYNEIFPDTSVRDLSIVSSSFNGYIRTHGMGYSFDPTDSGYYSQALTVNGGQLQTPVNYILPPTNQAFPLANPTYSIDSFFVLASYIRNDASVIADSLIIELVVAANWAADTGSYNLQTTTATTSYYPDCYDERPRFGTLHYNAGHGGFPLYTGAIYHNDCYFDSIWAPKERFAFALTAADAGDTTNGFLNLGHMVANTLVNNTAGTYSGGAVGQLNLPLPAPITIDPTTGLNPHLVTFVSFKSGHAGGTYPLGTATTAANYMKLFTGVPSGSTTTWWQQSSGNSSIGYQGSYNVGVQAWGPQAYDDAFYTFNGHDVLISAYDFTGPGNEIPLEGFHINWNSTPATGIRNINTLDNIAVYPNPANNSLNITFSAAQNSVATVSLLNMVGQVVATQNVTNGKALFNTSEVPSGMYIYAIEANGTRSTGHVAITH